MTFMPDALVSDMLYISVPYDVAIHLCLCGCGNKVVTPLAYDFWSIAYDGDLVSLTPSISNSSLPCRSHYWIRNSQVVWCA